MCIRDSFDGMVINLIFSQFEPRKQRKGDNETGYQNRWRVLRWAGSKHFCKTSMYLKSKDLNRKKISCSSVVVLFTFLWNCSVCKILPGKLTCSLMEISPSTWFHFWHCSEPSGRGVRMYGLDRLPWRVNCCGLRGLHPRNLCCRHPSHRQTTLLKATLLKIMFYWLLCERVHYYHSPQTFCTNR